MGPQTPPQTPKLEFVHLPYRAPVEPLQREEKEEAWRRKVRGIGLGADVWRRKLGVGAEPGTWKRLFFPPVGSSIPRLVGLFLGCGGITGQRFIKIRITSFQTKMS